MGLRPKEAGTFAALADSIEGRGRDSVPDLPDRDERAVSRILGWIGTFAEHVPQGCPGQLRAKGSGRPLSSSSTSPPR